MLVTVNHISSDELTEGMLEYESSYNALAKKLVRRKAPLISLQKSRDFHQKLRKTGATPEHIHQVRSTFRAYNRRRALKKAGINVDILFSLELLHDTKEDNPHLTKEEMKSWYKGVAKTITQKIVDYSFAMDKNGLTTEEYYERLLGNPYLILAKLFERTDNFVEIGGLSPKKQAACVLETILFMQYVDRMHGLYPRLDAITHECKETIWLGITCYLNAAWAMKANVDDPLIKALTEVKLLHRPLSETNRKRFVRDLNLVAA